MAKGFREWQAKFNIVSNTRRFDGLGILTADFPQNFWTQTTVLLGKWIAEHDQWELKVQRGNEEKTVKCKYIVLAVGANSRFPIQPTYENRVRRHSIAS